MEKSVYRADIDGLRAIAVVGVVAYHLKPTLLPGGFLGVDVFFVISGFLITAILAREFATGGFSLWHFYERRLRRIGPALITILLVTSAVATAVLLPVDLTGFARSLLATLGFVSNIYFWRDTDYFSRAAAEKPLLHTWSLGIEEQFYILFPMLLFVGYRIGLRAVPVIVALVTLGSLAATIVALKIGAGLPAFYLLPTRAWELGAGAMIVFAARWPDRGVMVREVVAAVALVAILAALAIDPGRLPALLPPALLPVAATAGLIAIGRTTSTRAGQLLGSRIPTYIGRRSYSLYLWHWPVLVFARYYLIRATTPFEDLALLLTMLVLAGVSYRFVETPFRRPKITLRHLLLDCGTGGALLLAVAAGLLATHGLPGRLNARAAQINAAVGTNYRCPIGDYLAFGASRGCTLALPSRDPADADVVLLGNSHAQMYAPLVASILAAHGLHGLLVPANGCLPWTATNIDVPCQAIAATNLAAVSALPRARLVIIAFNWGELSGDLVDRAGRRIASSLVTRRVAPLDATIAALRASGKQVLIVGPIAVPGSDIASILSRELAFGRPVDQPLASPAAAFEAAYGPALAALGERRDLVLIRPDHIQCRAGRCDYIRDGISLFADDNHLAAAATDIFRPAFEPAIVAALTPSPLQPTLPVTTGDRQVSRRGAVKASQ